MCSFCLIGGLEQVYFVYMIFGKRATLTPQRFVLQLKNWDVLIIFFNQIVIPWNKIESNTEVPKDS